MLTEQRRDLLRRYAAGEVSWYELRDRGFADYIEVLGGLGELGLHPPLITAGGPNHVALERGRNLLREALKARR